MIPIFWPNLYRKEWIQELDKIFKTRWIGQGPVVDKFEKEFGKKFGYKNCLAVNSGTSALELAYHMIGFKEGDEVITPVLTCTATNVWFLRNKVNIVFADIKSNTLTINPFSVGRKITHKTKAIVATTLGGMPIDEEIFELGRKNGIPVIVDACQSLGVAESQGDYICYSFQAIKHFTTGDGGMLVCKRKKDYKRAKKLRWFGIDREAKIRANWKPYKKREMTMDIEEPGFKYHMNDIAAILGLVGLRNSDKALAYRRKIAKYYDKHLKFHRVMPDFYFKGISGGSYWLYGVLVNNRDKVAKKLEKAGIETNMAHLRNDIFKCFGGKRLDLLVMNSIEDLYLYLPINTKMNMADVKKVVKEFNKCLLKKI